jgi:hypothetical protein
VLIETRGNGGFAVLAPSRGKAHPTGRPDRLLRGGVESIATISPEERETLFDLARSFDEMPRKRGPVIEPSDEGDWLTRPGDDFNARANWRAILEPDGWTYLCSRGEVDYWRRPDKKVGVSATTNFQNSGWLYVFSTSTELDANRGYSKLSAYSILNHRGSFREAANALAKQGYGTPAPASPRGLLGRFLYALSLSPLDHRRIDAPDIPATVAATYHMRVLALLRLPFGTDSRGQPTAHTLRLDPAATAALRAFEAWIEPHLADTGARGTITDWAGKLVGAVARIAALLHQAERGTELSPWESAITADTVSSAIQIAHYLIPHAHAAFGQMGADERIGGALYLLRWIKAAGVEAFTKRDAYRGIGGRFKLVANLETPLRLLEEYGDIRVCLAEDRAGAGRNPSPTYLDNPLACADSVHSVPKERGPHQSNDPTVEAVAGEEAFDSDPTPPRDRMHRIEPPPMGANDRQTVAGEGEQYAGQPFADRGPKAAVDDLVNYRNWGGDLVTPTPRRVLTIQRYDKDGSLWVRVEGTNTSFPIDLVEVVASADMDSDQSAIPDHEAARERGAP